jgi:hypothetical protein
LALSPRPDQFEGSPLEQFRKALGWRFTPHRHNALLAAILAAFALRPLIGDIRIGVRHLVLSSCRSCNQASTNSVICKKH